MRGTKPNTRATLQYAHGLGVDDGCMILLRPPQSSMSTFRRRPPSDDQQIICGMRRAIKLAKRPLVTRQAIAALLAVGAAEA
jgi:hypothetical protein